MPIMRWAPAQDRTVYVVTGPSGGRPALDRARHVSSAVLAPPDRDAWPRINVVHLLGDAVFYPYAARAAALGAIGRWIAHWVVFRGGWTVYVDAPDRDPIKIRCANRTEAQVRAGQVAERIEAEGEEAVDRLS
jgi:hypothetical protein